MLLPHPPLQYVSEPAVHDVGQCSIAMRTNATMMRCVGTIWRRWVMRESHSRRICIHECDIGALHIRWITCSQCTFIHFGTHTHTHTCIRG